MRSPLAPDRVFHLKSLTAMLLTASLLTGVSARADSSGSFGRLFTTVEERLALDQWAAPRDPALPVVDLRISAAPETSPSAESVAVETSAPARAALSGVLLRHDGHHLVWINGKSELSTDRLSPQIRAGLPRAGSLQVPVRAEDNLQWLKPGQVWLIDEGRVEEAYRVTSVPPRPDPESAPDDPP